MILTNEKIILDELVARYPVISSIKNEIYQAYLLLKDCYENHHKLLIAGNGGSAADADHIVGELMKGFKKERIIPSKFAENLKALDYERGGYLTRKIQGALPAIALNNHSALNTAYLNDVDGVLCYAQQVYGYGNTGDVFLGITTSGNSENIIYSALVAKAKGMKVIGLIGKNGGKLKGISDVSIIVPEEETYKIQELHLPIYHTLCLMLEEYFYKD